MILRLRIETCPQSFDAEDAIENALQDRGLESDLEYEIGRAIQEMMGWRDLDVNVTRLTDRDSR